MDTNMEMEELMEEVVFEPLKGRSGAHIQTLWAYLVQAAPAAEYRREEVETPDGDTLCLDWVDSEPDAPVIVIHHGLEGYSGAPYVRRLVSYAATQGYGVLVMNARGCGGTPNARVESYHAAWTKDISLAIDLLVERFPEREIALVGYSLGGSQMAAPCLRQLRWRAMPMR